MIARALSNDTIGEFPPIPRMPGAILWATESCAVQPVPATQAQREHENLHLLGALATCPAMATGRLVGSAICQVIFWRVGHAPPHLDPQEPLHGGRQFCHLLVSFSPSSTASLTQCSTWSSSKRSATFSEAETMLAIWVRMATQ